ncbi:MAG: hypothetical protein ACFE85_05180 [Candidatus Hodarchaeota archaeon]
MSKRTAQDLLSYIIESSNNDNLRIDSIKFISKIIPKHSEIFKFLEYILVSDSNEAVRFAAFKALKKNFPFNAKEPIKHAIRNETSVFLISLVEFLSELDYFDCYKTIIELARKDNDRLLDLKIHINSIKKLSLKQLKTYFYNKILSQSLESLYFHRHHIPLALDFYGIDEF